MSNNKIKEEVLKEIWEENKVCYDCKTISYGDGNCHCKNNNWQLTDKKGLQKAIDLTLKKSKEEFLKLIDDRYLNSYKNIFIDISKKKNLSDNQLKELVEAEIIIEVMEDLKQKVKEMP